MWSHRAKEMKTEKHCQRHGPASDPYCVNCHKDQLAKEKADDRLARTDCSRSFSALVELLMAINRYGDGASMMHPRLTMAIGAARKTVDEILNERPERESETSVHDECARSPSYHGCTRCAKCNEVHWMHGECNSPENANMEAPNV